MVQVIYANPRERKQSFGEQLGHGLSKGLEKGLELYQKHEKKKRYGEALKGVEDIYSDPNSNLSQEQKFVKSFSSLKEFPEAAKQFSSGLSQFTETPLQGAQRKKLDQEMEETRSESEYFNQLMGGGQKTSKKPPGMVSEEEFMGNEPTERGGQGKAPTAQFDANDPSTWSKKQLENFRSYQGNNAKGKSLGKRAENEYVRRETKNKETKKYQEDVAPFQSALETIDVMEKLGKKGNLGFGTSARGLISPKARKDAAEYERLGKSLISLSSNIPIRNQREFDALAHDLYDPSITDDARDGILQAMKRIIQGSMQGIAQPDEFDEEEGGYQSRGAAPSRKTSQQERPPLTSFLR